MSGHFEKGRWIEPGKEPLPDNIEIGVKVRVDDSELDELSAQIQETREMLDKAIDDAIIYDHKRLMKLEYTVQRAGFRQRLWYLITGKL